MATFYIQLEDRLLQISGELTAENISKALGYVPVSPNVTNELSQRVDNISFDNLKDNPFLQDGSGELNIVDEAGNVVAKVDSEGIHSVDFIAGEHKLTDKIDSTALNGYAKESWVSAEIAKAATEGKIDLTGYATEEWVEGKNYLTEHQDISHLATKQELSDLDFYSIKDNPIINEGNGQLIFVDESGYIGLQLEEDGLHVKDVIADGHVLSEKANASELSNYATKDEVSSLVDMSVVEELQGKVNTLVGEDSAKSVRTIANEELAALLLAGNDNLQSLLELAAWIDEHPEDASAMNEAIQSNTSNITKLDTAYKEADIKVLTDANEYTDNINFYTIKDNPIVNGEAGSLTFVDETGYIGLKVTEDGIIAKDVVTPEHKLSDKANISDIPTKLSQLENNTNYITKTEVADSYLVKGDYALKSDVEVEVKIENGVYAVTADGKLIDYNLADATATGVALVAGEHKFMIAKSDATNDGSNYNLYWTNNTSDLSLTNYTKSDGTNGSGYLPKPDGTFGGSTHLSDDFTTWTNGALSDFNGKANTAVIAAASSHAKDMCTVLNTFNASDSFKDWYVPACGQLALMYLNMTEINAALAKIGGTALAAGYYWSSSEYSSLDAWRVGFLLGSVSSYFKDNYYRVRFVRDLIITEPLKERVSDLELSVFELLSNVYTKEEIDSMLSISKYEFVDLGLPSGLKWAAWNVGATKPEEYGLYFAWGETEGYTAKDVENDIKQFSWSDYKLCGGSSSTLTKYNNNSSYGTVDTLNTLEQVDDAAYVSDNTCRMPTKVDFEELTANTTSTWETLNGVYGRRFTSKTNGNSIFVPAAGYCYNGSVSTVGSYGYLWSSSLNESGSRYAWYLYFNSDSVNVYNSSRCNGFSVRAVQEPNTNTKFNPSETVSKVNNLESQLGDINTILESIING